MPQNFILITLDTQRDDFVSFYSGQNAQTPNLDFLARQSLVFKNCFSLIPITLPAHAAIFYSVPPLIIKNYNNGQIIRNKRSLPSFVNIFKKNGFLTAAFISLGVLKSQFGLNKGFDSYSDDFPERRWYLYADEVNQRVFPWLDRHKTDKFFLWVHYSDPHDPYAPPDTPDDTKLFFNNKFVGNYCLNKYLLNEVEFPLKPGRNEIMLEVDNPYVSNPDYFQSRLDKMDFTPLPNPNDLEINFIRGWFILRRESKDVYFFKKQGTLEIINRSGPRTLKIVFRGKLIMPIEATREHYKKEVEYMDGEIGRLWNKLKELDLFSNTAILVVGDHGEGLGEYWTEYGDQHIGHIHYLYNVYLKVPLIIYNPQSLTKGLTRTEPVTLLDIGPSVLDIMGFRKLSSFQGRNLLNLEKRSTIEIFEETYKPEAYADRFALFHFPWHVLFTPEKDKWEAFDLNKDPNEKENIYSKIENSPEITTIKKHLETLARQALNEKEEVKIDKKTEEMLRTLGYIK